MGPPLAVPEQPEPILHVAEAVEAPKQIAEALVAKPYPNAMIHRPQKRCGQTSRLFAMKSMRKILGMHVCRKCYDRHLMEQKTHDIDGCKLATANALQDKYEMYAADQGAILRHPEQRLQMYKELASSLKEPNPLFASIEEILELLPGLHIVRSKLVAAIHDELQISSAGRSSLLRDSQLADVLAYALSSSAMGRPAPKQSLKKVLCQFALVSKGDYANTEQVSLFP